MTNVGEKATKKSDKIYLFIYFQKLKKVTKQIVKSDKNTLEKATKNDQYWTTAGCNHRSSDSSHNNSAAVSY